MTTSPSPQRRRISRVLAAGAALPTLLMGLGAVPALADPPLGCASPKVPVVNQCTDPILAVPQEPMPPEDYWHEPLLPERSVDQFINQFAPEDFIIGNLSPYEIAPGEEVPGIIPLLPPEIPPLAPPEEEWREEGH